MALIPNTASTGLWPEQAMESVTQWVQGLLGHRNFSPEEALADSTTIDPRLLPHAPMSAENIDAHLLNELGKMGLKRGKLITNASHPELMEAWRTMSQRAGLKKIPQLILTESSAINAMTLSSGEEVVVTTGLFKLLDAREVAAVLGHEFAHEKSNHQRPRMVATALLGGAGIVAGDSLAYSGGIGPQMHKLAKGEGPLKKITNKLFSTETRPLSVLSTLVYMAVGGWMGNTLANQLTVKPTELDADAKSIAISGDPEALISALGKLEAAQPAKGFSRFWGYLNSGYPTTEHRIERLRSLSANTPSQPLLPSVEAGSVLPPASTAPGLTISQIAAETRVLPPAQVAVG